MGAAPYTNYIEDTNSLKKTWSYGSYNCSVASSILVPMPYV